jgi:hypothetical protein
MRRLFVSSCASPWAVVFAGAGAGTGAYSSSVPSFVRLGSIHERAHSSSSSPVSAHSFRCVAPSPTFPAPAPAPASPPTQKRAASSPAPSPPRSRNRRAGRARAGGRCCSPLPLLLRPPHLPILVPRAATEGGDDARVGHAQEGVFAPPSFPSAPSIRTRSRTPSIDAAATSCIVAPHPPHPRQPARGIDETTRGSSAARRGCWVAAGVAGSVSASASAACHLAWLR